MGYYAQKTANLRLRKGFTKVKAVALGKFSGPANCHLLDFLFPPLYQKSFFLYIAGLVQQTVQIVVRCAHTI
jgi:hypothetical protein